MSRALRGLLASAASLPVFWWLFSELAMLYEMSLVPGSSRADLGDDFGLGLLLLFVVTPLSLLASALLGGSYSVAARDAGPFIGHHPGLADTHRSPEKPRMKQHIDDLLARIEILQNELEEEYRRAREDWEQKKQELADEFLRHQRRYKTGLFRFLLRSRLLVILSAPVIYAGWIPFLLLDLFVTVYQAICFPIYRIPKVRRSDYLVFDRAELPYLNIIEKFNCFYCSYGNGVAAYFREVAARTEQYWCPIKHARRVKAAHDRYPKFFDYGDAEAFQQGLNRLRRQYGEPD